MVEAGNFLEQYKVMSPKERNTAFGILVRSLPFPGGNLPISAYDLIDAMNANPDLLDELKEKYHPGPITKDETMVSMMELSILGDDEQRRRRENSTYKRIFMARVQGLSQFAHTTRALWEVVVDELSEDFNGGVDQKHLFEWFTDKSLSYPILLDSKYQNGGAFSEDKNEAIGVEREYYHHVTRRWRLQAEDRKRMERLAREMAEEIENDPGYQAIKDELEEEWRAEREAKERGDIPLSSTDRIDYLLERREQEEALIHYVDSDIFRKKWKQEFMEKYGEEPQI